jgi:hypothetical protein
MKDRTKALLGLSKTTDEVIEKLETSVIELAKAFWAKYPKAEGKWNQAINARLIVEFMPKENEAKLVFAHVLGNASAFRQTLGEKGLLKEILDEL